MHSQPEKFHWRSAFLSSFDVHVGWPRTLLYEHIAPLAPPFTIAERKCGRYMSASAAFEMLTSKLCRVNVVPLQPTCCPPGPLQPSSELASQCLRVTTPASGPSALCCWKPRVHADANSPSA